MTLEQFIQANILWADLIEADSHFTSIGINDMAGIVHLKAALVALSNVADYEPTIRPTYKIQPAPSQIIKPHQKQLTFAKYLRNKFIGHIHPQLIAKAIEWQPILRQLPGGFEDPKFTLIVNIWLLETTINTYVNPDEEHKLFDSETDLMYPPDWERFLEYLEKTIRASISYLQSLQEVWGPSINQPKPGDFDLELAMKAGKTKFEYLKQ